MSSNFSDFYYLWQWNFNKMYEKELAVTALKVMSSNNNLIGISNLRTCTIWENEINKVWFSVKVSRCIFIFMAHSIDKWIQEGVVICSNCADCWFFLFERELFFGNCELLSAVAVTDLAWLPMAFCGCEFGTCWQVLNSVFKDYSCHSIQLPWI